MIGSAPRFWEHGRGGLTASLLAPIGALVGAAAARRDHGTGFRAPVTVFCCGNATVGGAGKTIVALDLLARLGRSGIAAHALTRGHGGRLGKQSAVRVNPDRHDAAMVGDEALLLAQAAPSWVCRDRAEAAQAAVQSGAAALVMDDGMQNITLVKDCTLLVVDGGAGFGNGLVMPAGPLRERARDAVARAAAVVLIGEDRHGVLSRFTGERPILRARLRPDPRTVLLAGKRVVAFAGIGRPGKFFDGMREAGVEPVRCIGFADHHPYSAADIERLRETARQERATLVTTEKDAARLPAPFHGEVTALGVTLVWQDDRIDGLLARTIERKGK